MRPVWSNFSKRSALLHPTELYRFQYFRERYVFLKIWLLPYAMILENRVLPSSDRNGPFPKSGENSAFLIRRLDWKLLYQFDEIAILKSERNGEFSITCRSTFFYFHSIRSFSKASWKSTELNSNNLMKSPFSFSLRGRICFEIFMEIDSSQSVKYASFQEYTIRTPWIV